MSSKAPTSEFAQTAGGDDFPSVPYYTVDATSHATISGLDFSNYRLPRLSGKKVIDIDYNGVSENDVPLPGWSIQLFRDDGDGQFEPDQDELVDTQVTGEDGRYQFERFPPGDYFVVELLQGDYEQTGGGDDFPQVPYYRRSVISGTVFDDLDFANFDFPDFRGTKYVDLTGDGITPDDDDRHPGQRIELFLDDGDGEFNRDLDELVRFTLTNLQGDYAFIRIPPGLYFVAELIAENYVQTDGGDNFPDQPFYAIQVENGVDRNDLDFSNAKVASIAGSVFFDRSGDGLTIDDPPSGDWNVQLYRDADGNGLFDQNLDRLIAEQRTDENGEYKFERLTPGPYFVVDDAPEQYRQTAGGDSFPFRQYYVVNLRSGENIEGKTFANGLFFTAGIVSRYLATGDFDRDGDPDVVVVNELANPTQPSGNVVVLLNDGAANLTTMRQFNVNGRPASVVAGDLDSDGDADLAVTLVGNGTTANNAGNQVLIVFSNGDGTFWPGETITSVGNGPIDLVAADLDGDNDLDLAVANFRSNSVTLLINQGRGTFRNGGSVGVGRQPISVVAHHLNNDGYLDLVVANHGSNTLSLLTNDGRGNFRVSGTVPTTPGPNDLAVADWDADGVTDVAVAGFTFDQVEIHYGLRVNASGGQSSRRAYSVSSPIQATHPQSIAPVDFDGDGDLDLAVAASEVSVVAILENRGGRFFSQGAVLPTAGGPESIAAADLNGDLGPDLVSTTLYRFSSSSESPGRSLGGVNVTTNRNVNVGVSITNRRSVVVPGERVSYEVRVENLGLTRVDDLRVQSLFPAELQDVEYTSSMTGAGSGNSPAGQDAIDDQQVVLSSKSVITYLVSGTIDPAARGEFEVDMLATVSDRFVETDPSNNRASDVDDLLPVVDLAITTDDGGADSDGSVVIPGESSVSYTATVFNNGPTTATEINVVGALDLPPGTNLASITLSQGEFDGTRNLWLVGELEIGQSATWVGIVNVTADAANGDLIRFSASLDTVAEIDPNPDNNSDSVETRIGPPAEVDPEEPASTPLPATRRETPLPSVPATLVDVTEVQRVGDFDGDGTPETLLHRGDRWVEVMAQNTTVVWGNWSGSAKWQDLLVGDVNGDGRDDILGRTDAGKWWVGISDGAGFRNERWGTWSTLVTWRDVMVADVSGDGRADVIGRTDAGAWWIARSDGHALINERWGQWSTETVWSRVILRDVTNDGRADIVGRTATGSWWAAVSTGTSLVNVRLPSAAQIESIFAESDPRDAKSEGRGEQDDSPWIDQIANDLANSGLHVPR